jgi:cytochrome c oxidase cbb3-type subunit 3
VLFGSNGVAATIACLLVALAPFANPQDTKESVNRETSKPALRGALVFKTYCQVCHGERGDGLGRAEMAITQRSPEYYLNIVRRGGYSMGRSAYMPPWQNELSEEQIADVVAYATIVGDPLRRGEAVYKTNCILCHGVRGDGKGRAASLFHPPPANLTRSDKDDDYKLAIIRQGGAALGRSPSMPSWNERLTDIEIRDLVGYLHVLVVTPSQP